MENVKIRKCENKPTSKATNNIDFYFPIELINQLTIQQFNHKKPCSQPLK